MEQKIRKEIESIKERIEWKKMDLDRAVKDFRESAAVYDAYHIENFIPKKIEEITEYRVEIKRLAEQKQLLEYMLQQG